MKANKRAAILLLGALLCAALLMGACKSEEQLAQEEKPPTLLQPEVNITQESPRAPDALNVSGSGKVVLTPDTATFYVTVLTEAKDAAAAQSGNAAKTEAVTAAILGAGVKEKDLQTQNVNLYEVYDYEKSPAPITGYRMTTTLFVTVSPIELAGGVISAAVAAGANGTNGLAFTVADTSSAYQNALRAAVADALGKAEAMAEALGVAIVPVPLSVNESSQSSPIPYDFAPTAASEADDKLSDMPLSRGEITITARVNVAYEMIAPTAP